MKERFKKISIDRRMLGAVGLIALIILYFACVINRAVAPSSTPTPEITTPAAVHIETHEWPRDIMLHGRWLAWTEATSGTISVYDLSRDQPLKLPNPSGRVGWLEGNNLYVFRLSQQPTARNPQPTKNLYRIELPGGNEAVLRQDIPFDAMTNGQYITSWEPIPEICQTIQNCQDWYRQGCRKNIVRFTVTDTNKTSLGTYPVATQLSDMTYSLLVFSEWMAPCDIKAHSGPIQVIDLNSQAYQKISGSSVSPGPDYHVVAATDRTVLYGFGPNRARLVQIHPNNAAELRADVEGVSGLGLAGPNVLLYSLVDPGYYAPGKGLYAINLLTGEQQAFVRGGQFGDIRWATGDESHVAWITGDGKLFIAPLDLHPGPLPSPFSSPPPNMPANEPQWYSPLPTPEPS